MIRFSAGLVVVAIGVLIGGVATSKLLLVYIAIGLSVAALIALAIGVVLKREELFGEQRVAAPAAAGTGVQPNETVDSLAARVPAVASAATGEAGARGAVGVARDHAAQSPFDQPAYGQGALPAASPSWAVRQDSPWTLEPPAASAPAASPAPTAPPPRPPRRHRSRRGRSGCRHRMASRPPPPRRPRRARPMSRPPAPSQPRPPGSGPAGSSAPPARQATPRRTRPRRRRSPRPRTSPPEPTPARQRPPRSGRRARPRSTDSAETDDTSSTTDLSDGADTSDDEDEPEDTDSAPAEDARQPRGRRVQRAASQPGDQLEAGHRGPRRAQVPRSELHPHPLHGRRRRAEDDGPRGRRSRLHPVPSLPARLKTAHRLIPRLGITNFAYETVAHIGHIGHESGHL